MAILSYTVGCLWYSDVKVMYEVPYNAKTVIDNVATCIHIPAIAMYWLCACTVCVCLQM